MVLCTKNNYLVYYKKQKYFIGYNVCFDYCKRGKNSSKINEIFPQLIKSPYFSSLPRFDPFVNISGLFVIPISFYLLLTQLFIK